MEASDRLEVNQRIHGNVWGGSCSPMSDTRAATITLSTDEAEPGGKVKGQRSKVCRRWPAGRRCLARSCCSISFISSTLLKLIPAPRRTPSEEEPEGHVTSAALATWSLMEQKGGRLASLSSAQLALLLTLPPFSNSFPPNEAL